MAEPAPISYRLPVRLGRLLARLWRLRVSGLDQVPPAGPVIVAGNHASLADGPLLAFALGGRRFIRFLAKRELFEVPLLGRYFAAAGGISLDRSGDVAALRAALDCLAAGGCLSVFPEGTRSRDGARGKAKPGLGFLAGRSGAPVVPARLVNTHRFPWARPLEVRFGAELRFSGDPADREQCAAFAERVLDRVFAL